MTSLDQLRAENARLEKLLDDGLREQLLAYPGVSHVAVGVKETAGDLTGDLCFRVYVDHKLSPDKLPADAVIPAEVAGVKTDVNIPPVRRPSLADETRYRPILGGIRITNGLLAHTSHGDGIGYGTLGCVGTNLRDKSVLALTNWHVLFIGGGGRNSKVHQPTPAIDPNTNQQTDKNVIGIVADGSVGSTADCAVVKLDTSWCRTCGIDWRDQVHGLQVNNYDGIQGTARAVANETVWIVGQGTGHRVQGTVVTTTEADFDLSYEAISDPRVNAPGGNYTQTFHAQLTIRAAGSEPFGVEGDSGAVVVNQRSEVVGLHFAHDLPPSPDASSNHIDDVIAALHALAIELNINATPLPTPSAPHRGAMISVPRLVTLPDHSAVWERVRERLESTDLGTKIAAAVEAHKGEAVRLVNCSRPVTLAWRREQGPAYLAHVIKSITEPGHEVPAELNGVSFEQMIGRMREVFVQHGSPPLRAALEHAGDVALEAAQGCRTVDQFLDRVAQR